MEELLILPQTAADSRRSVRRHTQTSARGRNRTVAP